MLKAKAVIKAYVVKPKVHIITSFFYPRIRSKKHAVIYPPIIREDILKLEMNLLHVRSTLIRQKKIGKRAEVGTHSVVIRNVKDDEHVFGNPAKRIDY